MNNQQTLENIGDLFLSQSIGPGLSATKDVLDVNASTILFRVDDTCEAPYNSIARGDDAKAYSRNSFSLGESTKAGSFTFQIVSGDVSAKTLTFDSVDGLQIGYKVAIRLLNNYGIVGSITNIDSSTNTITLDNLTQPSRYDEKLNDPYISADPLYDATGNTISVHYGYYQLPSEAHPHGTMTPEATAGKLPAGYVSQAWIFEHPELGTNDVLMEDAYAQGWGCIAQGSQSHAQGRSTNAYGRYSHAEGSYTLAGYNGHSEGYHSSTMLSTGIADAGDQALHSEGAYTWAANRFTHSDGINAVAKDSNSYVWNGKPESFGNNYQFPNENTYYSNGAGTFNVNPKDGISGFFIGLSSLDKIIASGGSDIPPDYGPQVSKLRKDVDDIQEAFGHIEYIELSDVYPYEITTSSFLQYWNGEAKPISLNTMNTSMIEVLPGDILKININMGANIGGYCMYDKNSVFLKSINSDSSHSHLTDKSEYIENGKLNGYEIVIPDDCRYIAFSSYGYSIPETSSKMKLLIKKVTYSAFIDRIDAIEQQIGNINIKLDQILA